MPPKYGDSSPVCISLCAALVNGGKKPASEQGEKIVLNAKSCAQREWIVDGVDYLGFSSLENFSVPLSQNNKGDAG